MRLAAIAAVAALVSVPVFAGGLFDDDDCKSTAKRHVVTPAAGITKVVIHGESGSLEVTGTPGATQIVADGTACTSDDDFLPRMTLSLSKSGTELHVDANIPEKTILFGFFSARLDFAVSLPPGVPVVIDDGSGWLKVSNTASTSIDDGSGAISVARIEGSLHIRDDGSGSITAQNIRRDVTVDEDGSGAIEVADVGGNFTVARKGSGSIDYERVSGRVSVPRPQS